MESHVIMCVLIQTAAKTDTLMKMNQLEHKHISRPFILIYVSQALQDLIQECPFSEKNFLATEISLACIR